MEKEYVEMFDNIFNSNTIKNIDIKKLKLLKSIFDNFDEELYTPSSKYRLLRKEHIRIIDALRPNLTEVQSQLLDKCLEVGNCMIEEEEYQLFILGCLLGYQLKEEFEVK